MEEGGEETRSSYGDDFFVFFLGFTVFSLFIERIGRLHLDGIIDESPVIEQDESQDNGKECDYSFHFLRKEAGIKRNTRKNIDAIITRTRPESPELFVLPTTL